MATAQSSTTIEYRDILGHPGYRVGNDGSVWSRWGHNVRKGARLSDNWHRLKGFINSHGYVRLTFKGRVQRFVHRLVLEAFVGPCPEGMEACHNDGNKLNNRLDNLRWDTSKGNKADHIKHGTSNTGSRHGRAKLTESTALEIWNLKGKQTIAKTARQYGISATVVSRIFVGAIWKHVVVAASTNKEATS